MVDKMHCFMNMDDFDHEYAGFYDFTKTYEEMGFQPKKKETRDTNKEDK